MICKRCCATLARSSWQWVYNHLESSDLNQVPELVQFDHNIYRRRDRSPRRDGIATLFGIISLWRIRYEPWDAGVGLTCIFPLEQRLGIVADKATPALASRVGMWTAQYTQETVLALLRNEHDVSWSVATLRKVAAELSSALAPLTHQAQVDHVLSLLHKANDSKGAHRPVLSVGRDGIFVPIRNDDKYREASTGTLAVLDRAGKRLGTVYLGQMPESGQGNVITATDGFGERCPESLGRSVAAFAIRDRWRSSPQRILCQGTCKTWCIRARAKSSTGNGWSTIITPACT